MATKENGYPPEGTCELPGPASAGPWGRPGSSLHAQMTAASEISRGQLPNPARVSTRKKCAAINADWIRAISVDDLAQRMVRPCSGARLCCGRTPQRRRQKMIRRPLRWCTSGWRHLAAGTGGCWGSCWCPDEDPIDGPRPGA